MVAWVKLTGTNVVMNNDATWSGGLGQTNRESVTNIVMTNEDPTWSGGMG